MMTVEPREESSDKKENERPQVKIISKKKLFITLFTENLRVI